MESCVGEGRTTTFGHPSRPRPFPPLSSSRSLPPSLTLLLLSLGLLVNFAIVRDGRGVTTRQPLSLVVRPLALAPRGRPIGLSRSAGSDRPRRPGEWERPAGRGLRGWEARTSSGTRKGLLERDFPGLEPLGWWQGRSRRRRWRRRPRRTRSTPSTRRRTETTSRGRRTTSTRTRATAAAARRSSTCGA